MNPRLVTLIDKLEHNSASQAELLELEELYNAFEVKTGYTHSLPDRTQYKEMIFERINRGILKHDIEQKKNTFKLWSRIAVAAAAIVVMVFGIWFYIDYPIVNPNSQIVYQNDIAPGKNTATLTLANGKAIKLSDAKTGVIIDASSLSYNDGSALELGDPELPQDLKAIANLTVTTPRGGTYQITLPDGTKVWLNAASSLTYTAPSKAQHAQRRVKLSGEAYFEVFKNENQPFVVNSKNQDVEVLGTHFNVNAYSDEPDTKTTLVEGAVKVSTKSGTEMLKPGQQSTLFGSNRIEVRQVDPGAAISWKDGNFVFVNQDIETIMRDIARWYNIEVKYEGGISTGEFSGNVSRSKNISEVLQALELTKLVHFKVEGRKVVVTK